MKSGNLSLPYHTFHQLSNVLIQQRNGVYHTSLITFYYVSAVLFSLHQEFYYVIHNISNFHLTGSKVSIIYCPPTAAPYIKHLGQVDISPILYPQSIGLNSWPETSHPHGCFCSFNQFFL